MSFARRWLVFALVGGAVGAGCSVKQADEGGGAGGGPDLAGQWRSTVQFHDGAFASVHDLEFMYVFNTGGTMTESSNYDASPPVPPAYGIWRKTGARRFEAKYEYYATAAPASIQDLTGGGGWPPAGRGVLTEQITIEGDGDTFTSTIRYEPLDTAGKSIPGGGEASGRGTRLQF